MISINVNNASSTSSYGTSGASSVAALPQVQLQQQEEDNSDEGMFESILHNAINNVEETDANLVQAQYLLSTGQLDNPATAMIAASKNELAVNLLVQLRNKALDAYSELTRISL
jgi:flagellar hook-basal body complex protein FliE